MESKNTMSTVFIHILFSFLEGTYENIKLNRWLTK